MNSILIFDAEDAEKLDDVREVLRREDISTASKLARVYRLTPITN
jgi:hypothetical protein